VEVADILHAQGDTFLEQHPWLSVQQRSVLRAIACCRTAALGGHLDRCDACGHQVISYNSCRNRHCPKCQAQARERWLRARERELLDVPYVHVVFTLPHALLPLTYRNSARLYTWLFQASAATLRKVAADPQHLGAEMLKSAARLDIRHVPYRGSVPAMLDVIAGHIPFMVVDLQPALPQMRDGKVRVLGVTTSKRVAAAPEIPTLSESGLPGFELVAWQGVVAPAGTPRAIVDALALQIKTLLADPKTGERFAAIALEPLPGSTPDSFAAFIKTEVDRWAAIVRTSGVEAE